MLFRNSVLVTYLMVSSFHKVSTKYYSPCNLARILYNFLQTKENTLLLGGNENVAKYMEDIPLLVCIAGYHGYNANFSYTTQDKVRHVGLFGLAEDEMPTDRSVESHSMKFLRDILRIQGTPWKNRNAFDFYESLCNVPHLAINVQCHINNYVFGSYPVIVPKDLDYLYNYYQSKDSYWTPLERNN